MKLRRSWFRLVLQYLNSLVFFFFFSRKWQLGGPRAQILLFSTRKYYGGRFIFSLPTSSSLFVIEFSNDLMRLALGLGVVVWLFYLVNLLNNQAPPPTTQLFLSLSANNGKLSDDLVGHTQGLGLRGVAINQPIAHHYLQPHCSQPCPLRMTCSLMMCLGAFWAKGCVVEIGGSYLSFEWKIGQNE